MYPYIAYSVVTVLSLISWWNFKETEESKDFARVSLFLALSAIAYELSEIARVTDNRTLYIAFTSIGGMLYLVMNFMLFIGIHKSVYVRVGAETLSILPIAMLIPMQEGSNLSLVLVPMGFIGVSFTLTVITLYMAINLARERKGGALFWYLMVLFTLTVFLNAFLSGLLLAAEELNNIDTGFTSFINPIMMFINSIILLLSSICYKKNILPKLKALSEL